MTTKEKPRPPSGDAAKFNSGAVDSTPRNPQAANGFEIAPDVRHAHDSIPPLIVAGRSRAAVASPEHPVCVAGNDAGYEGDVMPEAIAPELPEYLADRDADDPGAFPRTSSQSGKAKADKAETPQFRLKTAVEIMAQVFPSDIVDGIVPALSVGLLWAPTGAAKSFLALTLAANVAEGLPFFGRDCEQVPVVYVVQEGEAGFKRRVAAWEAYNGRPFPAQVRFVSGEPFQLCNVEARAALVAAIQATGMAGGLLILDTLARTTMGLDENSSEDVGRIIYALTALRDALGGTVLAVHHCGKDAERGPRGHSSLLAAVDFAIRVERVGDLRNWSVSKAKDDVDGGSNPFTLRSVVIGTKPNGEALTSCVVEPRDAGDMIEQDGHTSGPPLGSNQGIALAVVSDLLRASGTRGKGEAPSYRPCIKFEEAVDAVAPKLLHLEPKRQKTVARRTISAMQARFFGTDGEWIWLS